ncbi:peptidoglycan DD-metalloendopeptidase family protein [Paramagnetospirillum magneticum]|uniref:Membrane protein n=1 Tax=Paramagnetospirillum magneticum (strain ATCC 700264 / AMB-1) TaxID=342108 RepID=Q2W8W9_PARM1|nr:peptidoglycan DD-metalloendopeptidase family protein [Paramagnetospirillum magneticum]BAE49706.1 Membrane protein [Paramagnetospirillum magneticum AMB-1]
MAALVTAKLLRSLKALAIALVVAGVAVMVSRPYVSFSPFGEEGGTLDSAPPSYVDMESEGSAQPSPELSDGELEDRSGRPVDHVLQVGSGETLASLLGRAGIPSADTSQVIEALVKVFDPRDLKAGQKVTVTFDPSPWGFGQGPFSQVGLAADPIREIQVRRNPKGGFIGREERRQVTRQVAHFSGKIKSSLFESATAAGIPAQAIINMIRVLSYDVDFQRDIQAGDSFEVLFDGWYDTKGKLVKSGDILYAGLDLSGAEVTLYRFEDGSGASDFFNGKGESAKKALLKTPVDGAKITSGFGLRHHPILGFSKMHKGVDFGVPPGTPIMAAGDGSVDMAGPNGAYGNYVRIRHGNGFSTAYAHMQRIAQGVHTGRRIMQGQIIGFVGSTGRSTGPHLHYEVLQGNNQVNPLSIKVPTGIKLAGRDMDRYQAHKRATDLLMAQIPSGAHVASNPGKPVQAKAN